VLVGRASPGHHASPGALRQALAVAVDAGGVEKVPHRVAVDAYV